MLALLRSLPMLMDVMVLCAFTFFMFGVVALQLFAGALRNRWGGRGRRPGALPPPAARARAGAARGRAGVAAAARSGGERLL